MGEESVRVGLENLKKFPPPLPSLLRNLKISQYCTVGTFFTTWYKFNCMAFVFEKLYESVLFLDRKKRERYEDD